MDTAERARYLEALDLALAPLGFRRNRRDRQWHRSTVPTEREWVHVNFGLGVINPSLGVEYSDLDALLPPEAGAVNTACSMLASLSGSQYSSRILPATLVADVVSFGLPELARLRDRESVIRRLKDPSPCAWPVASSSHRARLLPLLLARQGRLSESLASLTEVGPVPDQLVPDFATFARILRDTHRG